MFRSAVLIASVLTMPLYLRAMADLFIKSPVFALVPAIFFCTLFIARRKRSILVTTLAWSAYFLNELAMKIFCADCSIRVELFIMYPLLIWASIVALVEFATEIFSSNNEKNA